MCNFVLLDLLKVGEINGLYGISSWVDRTNGSIIHMSLNDLMLYFERTQGMFLNCNISGDPVKESYTEEDLDSEIDCIGSNSLIDLINSFSELMTTRQFITRCSCCGEWYSTTRNTFVRRGSLYCKECYANSRLIQKNGSILDSRPDVLEFWSKRNKLSPDKYPVGGGEISRRKYWVVCPSCGIEIEKRLDAILSSGARCGACAKRYNVPRGRSLREDYPSVAMMFDKASNYDKAGNRVYSSDINYGSSDEYEFYCDNGGVPHTFRKSLNNMVSAHKIGNLGCPVCAGFKVVQGVNDLETKLPELARYWDEAKNGISAREVYFNSESQYWWVCPQGHSFKRDPLHMRRSIGTSTLGCPVCHGKEVRVGVNDLPTIRPDLLMYWDYEKNVGVSPEQLTSRSNKDVWWRCSKCGKSFMYNVDSMFSTNGLCEECRLSNYSRCEKALVGYIRNLGIDVQEEAHIYSNRSMSADIYIPTKKLAIEYNGLYWHSDAVRKDPMYHYKKYNDLKKRGIRQYTVWDDDFNSPEKRDIILKSIKRLLGVGDEERVNARDCEVVAVTVDLAREFLNKHHIQGFVSGTDYVGLQDKSGRVESIAVFLEYNDGILRLSRYATSCNVRGGFSKIVKVVGDCNKDAFKGILTFSDNLISTGSLYSMCGFKCIGELKPDYSYMYNGVRVHKFNFRKEAFKRNPDLFYQENLTERQLAELNGIPRIYDAGKLKWYYEFS